MTGVITGAIRWDAWYTEGAPGNSYQPNLYPAQFQYRAPWFFNTYPGLIDGAGNRQAVIDLEIQYAAAAGLTFWAYDQYAPPSAQMNAWNLHQSSSFKNLMNWCFLAVSDSLFGSTSNFSTQVAQYVTWFQQSNYQKVLGNRPLLFMFGFDSFGSFGGSTANFAAMITSLRSACIAASLGSPYIVWMDFSPILAKSLAQQVGADAISSYAAFASVAGQSYATLVKTLEAEWITRSAQGMPIIPNVMFGADTRPRGGTWAVPGTVPERVAHLQDAIRFVKNNPVACETNAVICYSWTELDEGGGGMIPTIGDPPQGPPPTLTNFLSGLQPVMLGLK